MRYADVSIKSAVISDFSIKKHALITIDNFLRNPMPIIDHASLQKFAKITPQYPGVRAPLDSTIISAWLTSISPLLCEAFNTSPGKWSMQGWHSLVTARPEDLLPIQRLPHVDGTDPNQIAMMLYLNRTAHGGTAFFRHKSTGFEDLTNQTYPVYKALLEKDVSSGGLPPNTYVSDGAPYFEKTFSSEGLFNQAVFYRGNLFHSGVIDPGAQLNADPHRGRYTINAFLRPPKTR